MNSLESSLLLNQHAAIKKIFKVVDDFTLAQEITDDFFLSTSQNKRSTTIDVDDIFLNTDISSL